MGAGASFESEQAALAAGYSQEQIEDWKVEQERESKVELDPFLERALAVFNAIDTDLR